MGLPQVAAAQIVLIITVLTPWATCCCPQGQYKAQYLADAHSASVGRLQYTARGVCLPAPVDGECELPITLPLPPQSQERGALLPDFSCTGSCIQALLWVTGRQEFAVGYNSSVWAREWGNIRFSEGRALPSLVLTGETWRHNVCSCGR